MILPIGATILTAAGLAWSVRGRSAAVWADSVWRGPAEGRRIALTFDDGPSEGTDALLEALARAGARATFFQCGHNAERLPAAAARVTAAGHTIGNHSWSHIRFDFLGRARMQEEIGRTQRLLTALHGTPPRWFRAPYGVRWPGLGEVQDEFGVRGAMWTTIARDWRLPAPAIIRRMAPAARPGAVLCFHDGRELSAAPDIAATVAAVGELTRRWREEGYQMVTLSDMFPS